MFGVWVIDVARNNELSLRHTATHCNTLQHTATHCNTLQHTATHCNMLHVTMSHWCCTQQTSRCSWLLSSSHIFCIVIFHHIFYYGTPHIPGVYHHATYSTMVHRISLGCTTMQHIPQHCDTTVQCSLSSWQKKFIVIFHHILHHDAGVCRSARLGQDSWALNMHDGRRW